MEGANPGFIYQAEAFDPEDTSRNIPLSVSLWLNQQGACLCCLESRQHQFEQRQWEEYVVRCQTWSTGEAGMGKGALETDAQLGFMAPCDFGQVLDLSEL